MYNEDCVNGIYTDKLFGIDIFIEVKLTPKKKYSTLGLAAYTVSSLSTV